MAKKGFNVRVEASVIDRLQEVASGHHGEGSKYAATVLSVFSDLRPEHSLDALASIPKDFFRRGPGRPTTAGNRTDDKNTVPPQNVR